MKKLLAALILIATSVSAQAADKYVFDKPHTNVIWSANHFGYSEPFGYFTDIDGSLMIDEKAPENSSVTVTIKTDSLQTPVAKFTEHLKTKDFLDVATYPEAKFVSTKVELTGNNTAKVSGDLTLHGVTKPLVLDVKLNNIGVHPYTQKHTVGFAATANLKRSEYGIQFGIPGISDNVRLLIQTEAIREDDNNAKIAK